MPNNEWIYVDNQSRRVFKHTASAGWTELGRAVLRNNTMARQTGEEFSVSNLQWGQNSVEHLPDPAILMSVDSIASVHRQHPSHPSHPSASTSPNLSHTNQRPEQAQLSDSFSGLSIGGGNVHQIDYRRGRSRRQNQRLDQSTQSTTPTQMGSTYQGYSRGHGQSRNDHRHRNSFTSQTQQERGSRFGFGRGRGGRYSAQ